MNKHFTKEIIKKAKKSDTPIELVSTVVSELFIAFKNQYTTFWEYNIIPESIFASSTSITPEIFSLLEELKLSLEDGQYQTGSYYTNKSLINQIYKDVSLVDKDIIDPSSGSGNFLIQAILYLKNIFENKNDMLNYIEKHIIFSDIKETSLDTYIIRLRLISINWFNEDLTEDDVNNIKEKAFIGDFLTSKIERKFDIIVGNPPYLGVKSLGKGYLSEIKNVFGYTDDLYSLFTIKSLQLLKHDGFCSFVTSSTYMTIRTKEHMREALRNKGLYKIILNHEDNFDIKTQTATFFVRGNSKVDEIKAYSEDSFGNLNFIKNIDANNTSRFSLAEENDTHTKFQQALEIYEKHKDNMVNANSLRKFSQTKAFKDLIENNDVVPLGLIAFVATGVDFKGNNAITLYSLDNKKFNQIESESEIEYACSINEFQNGLDEKSGKKYIPAIKGKDRLFVKWNKEHFEYLKGIKAPLRNLSLYGDSDLLYCKTSTYEFHVVDKHTLCINTAGACFIRPIIDINIEDILSQIDNSEYKEYIKLNINNSLCITPNDLKLVPINIK
jgi:methylase of polypeptide subunit release factors